MSLNQLSGKPTTQPLRPKSVFRSFVADSTSRFHTYRHSASNGARIRRIGEVWLVYREIGLMIQSRCN